MLTQPPIPSIYTELSDEALSEKIRHRKSQLGKQLVMLGHHYQRDEIIDLVDFIGDSLKLSQLAAAQHEAKYIVFCGVHFMAESADILSGPQQVVCLPNLSAGCSMAELADDEDMVTAMQELSAMTGEKIVPITYVNSTAAVKAATGRFGGACCTSSNARSVFEWALRPSSQGGAGAGKVLALPDEHLARNTAAAMGYSLDQCVLYDPRQPAGGLSQAQVQQAKFILWKGHCYVHQRFKVEHVQAVRAKHPGIRVMVHGECSHDVVSAADAFGSTEQIIKAVESSAPGTNWAIGTESNMVSRLARRHCDRLIRTLSDAPSFCTQMMRIDLPHVAWVLDNLAEGKIVNQVKVDSELASQARIALERMINLK